MRVLIFTASAGGGHNSAAKTLREKFLQNPENTVEVIDAFGSYARKIDNLIITTGYIFACKYIVSAYNAVMRKEEKTDFRRKVGSKAISQGYSVLKGMLDKIYSFKPDLIISTYIFCSVALSNLKRAYDIPAKIASLTLDYGVSPFWERCSFGLDYMFLTEDYMTDVFLKKGFSKDKLFVTGIPVSDMFKPEGDKPLKRRETGLKENLFTVVVMKASFFPFKPKKLIDELKKANCDYQAIIINGKRKREKNKTDRLINKYKLNGKVINVGFTEEVHKYFGCANLVVGKGGGLTYTETLNSGIPSLSVGKLPQQEIENKEYLTGKGCVMPVKHNDIAGGIEFFIRNETEYIKFCDCVEQSAKPHALNDIYTVLSKVENAEYKDEYRAESKRKIIKKVNKKVKESVKAFNCGKQE